MKIYIVNYGIDDYNPSGVVAGNSYKDGINLLFLSNYMESKGILTFIDIIHALKEKIQRSGSNCWKSI